jgi:hypothetical protein
MQEQSISNSDWHQTFTSCGSNSNKDSCADEGAVGCGQCLPDIGANDDESTCQSDWSPTEDIGAGYDEEICVAECKDTSSCLSDE